MGFFVKLADHALEQFVQMQVKFPVFILEFSKHLIQQERQFMVSKLLVREFGFFSVEILFQFRFNANQLERNIDLTY